MTQRSRWARAHAPDLVDRITVATRRGGGGRGPSYAEAVTVLGYARGERTLTRGEDGEEAAGELTLKLPPAVNVVDAASDPVLDAGGQPVELEAAALFTPGSEVEALGYRGRVLVIKTATYRGRVERVDVTVG